MAVPPKPLKRSASFALRLAILLILLLGLLSAIFYIVAQRPKPVSTKNLSPAQEGQSFSAIDLEALANDPRFLRLKALDLVPEPEGAIGRDNPFSGYQAGALNPSRGTR